MLYLDPTRSNILFSVSEAVGKWSYAEVYVLIYAYLRVDEDRGSQDFWTTTPRLHTPPDLVAGAPIENSELCPHLFFKKSVMISDFSQSYVTVTESPPRDSQPGTVLNNLAPETRFEGRTGPETDVWALGCAIFEIRAMREVIGHP